MTKDDFIRLYEKSLNGTLSPQEQHLLDAYDDDLRLDPKPWNATLMGDQDRTGRDIYKQLQDSMKQEQHQPVIRRWKWLRAAAIFLSLIGAGIWLWSHNHATQDKLAQSRRVSSYKNDIGPGGDKATLTLSNGSVIELDSAGNGVVSNSDGARVVKAKDGLLTYIADTGQAKEGGNADKPSFNIVSTPRGGQYKIVLPDGSKVWLNAASSLRFPAVFAGSERRVELRGQAYFEIAHSAAMPFFVALQTPAKKNLQVQVLGTDFDIMAYEDENFVNTTLVSGSVRVDDSRQALLLKPGEQAQLSAVGALHKEENADVDAATAWKNGRFEFNGNIKGIMRQIARWYNVEVKYEGNLSDKAFGGAISRAANVSEVLKILELTGSIHFIVDGNTITVIP